MNIFNWQVAVTIHRENTFLILVALIFSNFPLKYPLLPFTYIIKTTGIPQLLVQRRKRERQATSHSVKKWHVSNHLFFILIKFNLYTSTNFPVPNYWNASSECKISRMLALIVHNWCTELNRLIYAAEVFSSLNPD